MGGYKHLFKAGFLTDMRAGDRHLDSPRNSSDMVVRIRTCQWVVRHQPNRHVQYGRTARY